MPPANLEAYLHAQIPLSRALGVRVREAGVQGVLLEAPLMPNVNHHETAFGGSVSALAILSAWSLVHVRLQAESISATVVIQRSTLDFDRPISGPFAARSKLDSPLVWTPFRDMLARKGKARIEVSSTVVSNGEDKAMFSGAFVALRATGSDRRPLGPIGAVASVD